MQAHSNSTLRLIVIGSLLLGSSALYACASDSTPPAEYPAMPENPPTSGAEAAAPAQAPAEAPAEAVAAAPAIETKEVTYSSGKTELKGFIAYPAGAEKHPAVIVVHEWWGHDDYARTRAIKLAELGYVGFAIDMYGGGKQASHPEDAQKFMMEALSNMDEAVKRFDAAKALISGDARVDASKLGAIGYCFGGAVSLHMARIGTDLDVIGVFHGNLGTKKPMARGVFGGKILIANGEADPMVPKEQVDAFKKEMDKAKATYEVVEYANAKHAFTNPAATENGTKFSLPLEYNAEADAASWQKLTDLLAQTWPK